MKKFASALVAAGILAFATPQFAQAQSAYPVERSGYATMGMIKIDDGHSLDYANFLASTFRKGQDYAKSQGWITDYQIWVNANARDGEGDIYLVTWFPEFSTVEEGKKRDKMYLAHMKSTEAQMEAESGKRANYRRQMGSMLFEVMKWTK